MAKIEYEIIKDYGIIATHGTVSLELKLMRWGENEPKYDLRAWQNGMARGGITMTQDEIKILRIIIARLNAPSKTEEKPKAKRGRPKKSEVKSTEKTVVEKPKTKKKKDADIIQFPKERPNIVKIKTSGNATYEQCEEKLNKEREKFPDADSNYVIDGLLELCKVDADFCNNVMLKEKTYKDAFKYMEDMARKGYAYKMGNMAFLDRDMGLAMCIDYFNLEEKKEVQNG